MKKLILLILLLSFSSIYSQNNKTKSTIKEFKFQTNNPDELTKFKWEKVYGFFEKNNQNDSIKIVMVLRNDDNINSKNNIKLNNLTTEIKGQVFELNKLILKAKEMTAEMIKTNKNFKKL